MNHVHDMNEEEYEAWKQRAWDAAWHENDLVECWDEEHKGWVTLPRKRVGSNLVP